MKKIVPVLLSLLFISSAAYGAGYCPTPQELQSKMNSFQQRALRNINANSSLEQAEALLNEQERYIDSIFPSCMQYFKTTQNPNCSKLATLSTGYIMLDKSKQPAAKSQLGTLSKLKGVCGYQYEAFLMMTK